MPTSADLTHSGRRSHPGAQPATLTARLRHAGVSFLPLGLFVSSVLGFEQLSGNGPAAFVEAPKAVASKPAIPAVTSSPSSPAATGSLLRDASAASIFDDRRDLQAVASAWHADWTPSPPVSARHSFILTPDDVASVPLTLPANIKDANGSYAALRGLPASARPSHGVPVSAGTWLIDAADLARVRIEVRGAQPGLLPLELTILSSQNRIVAREDVSVEFKVARPPPAPATVETFHLAPQPLPKFEVAVAADTTLAAGRGSLLALHVTPAERLPAGAYVVLRGLPDEAQLSSGLSIGRGVWMLSKAEMASVEVRLPARAAGEVTLDVRLATAEGQVLAEAKRAFKVSVPAVRAVTVATTAAPAQTTGQAVIASGAAASVVSVPAPVPATRPATARATPAPASAPIDAALPEPKSKAAAAEDRVAGNPILSRGRKMLLSGNVAVARPLLERAASEGSGEAAALLGASFDPLWLQKVGAVGIIGDLTRARSWYDEARRLGSRDIERIVAIPGTARPGVNVR